MKLDTKLDALYRLGQELLLLRDEQQIAEAVLKIAEDVLEFHDSEFLLVDETRGELVAVAGRGMWEQHSDFRLPLDGERGITVAVANSGEPIRVPDVRKDPRYVYVDFPSTSELAVPAKIEGRVLGVINVESQEADAFTPADVQLLTTLASQAALALENAHLHAQEQRRIEELAAVNQIARNISATLDLQETLDSIVGAVAELVPCSLAEISLWDEERQMLTLQALRCDPERTFPIGESYPPGEGYTGWVVRHKQPLFVPDVNTRQDLRPDLLPGEHPFQAYVGLPLMAGEELIGTLVLIHERAGAFEEQHLRLLEGLAGQAAITIRNARLYEELARRHREMAALNAVAAAINQALDLETLLADAVERVVEVVSADAGGVRLLDRQTDQLTFVYSQGLSEEYSATIRSIPLGEGTAGHVALTGEPALIEDMWTRPSSRPAVRAALMEEGLHARAEVPLRSREHVVGTLGVAARTPGAFGQADLELLTAIGQQLGVAIANAQLFEDTQRNARRLAALNALASVINQPLPLQEIMDQAILKMTQVMEVEAGCIRLLDQATEELTVVSFHGLGPDYIERERSIRLGEGPVGQAAQSGEPLVVENLAEDPRLAELGVTTDEFRAFAIVPLRVQDRTVGTLGVATSAPRGFDTEELNLVMALGHQIGVAIENARLRQQALDAERLAAVGRVASAVAHNLRSPLGGIIRSAEFLGRPELSGTTRQKLSQAIVAMARRLINTAQEILDYTRGGQITLDLAPCPLSDFLEQVIAVIKVDFSDRGIEVMMELGYTGEVWVDPSRMTQVIYNIATNARDAMPTGGKLTVTTQQAGEWVEMRFTDTGPGVPPELASRIFEPFFSHGKQEGAGLGLAIARRIVREHGGEIEIESPTGGGATFVVRLPLDRRAAS